MELSYESGVLSTAGSYVKMESKELATKCKMEVSGSDKEKESMSTQMQKKNQLSPSQRL